MTDYEDEEFTASFVRDGKRWFFGGEDIRDWRRLQDDRDHYDLYWLHTGEWVIYSRLISQIEEKSPHCKLIDQGDALDMLLYWECKLTGNLKKLVDSHWVSRQKREAAPVMLPCPDPSPANGPRQWAKILGGMNPQTFSKHCRDGKIPHIKLTSKSYMVSLAWLQSQGVQLQRNSSGSPAQVTSSPDPAKRS